ncbi:MAG: hypothetical protein ACP5VP_01285 [Candidatus Limnocylindrales bacterium]
MTVAPSGPSALIGVPGPLPAGMQQLVFDGTPLLVQDPSAWNRVPDTTRTEVVRELLAHAQAERVALAAHDLTALGLPVPRLLVGPLPTPGAGASGALVPVPLLDAAAGAGAAGAGGGAPFRLAAAGGTSVTTTYGGPGNPGFNIVGTSNVQPYYNCETVLGVKVCLRGYASGWVSASPEGVLVNATAAAGIAGVEADQWLGTSYTARAPSGSASAITVTATLATQDETGGVSGIGVGCAPLIVYEEYPLNEDYPPGNQQQSNQLASCLDSLSVAFPVFDADGAAAAGAQVLTQTLDALNNAGTVLGFLNALSGTYNVTTVTWSGLVWGGRSIQILVDPYAAAFDAGAGTVVNVARSVLTLQVTDIVGGGGGCDRCHPMAPPITQPTPGAGATPTAGTAPWVTSLTPYVVAPGASFTIRGTHLGTAPGFVLFRACRGEPGPGCPTITVDAQIRSWTDTTIVGTVPSALRCRGADVWVELPNGETVGGSHRAVEIQC